MDYFWYVWDVICDLAGLFGTLELMMEVIYWEHGFE